jgi:hypothetical protein
MEFKLFKIVGFGLLNQMNQTTPSLWTGRGAPISLSSWSPDVKTLGFFLWIYVNKPRLPGQKQRSSEVEGAYK